MRAGSRLRHGTFFLFGVVACVALWLSLLGSASAAIPFCLPGSGAGQCDGPKGLAIDVSLERVYVADRGNNRIDVFDTAGDFVMAFGWGVQDGGAALQVCTSSCQKGIAGAGAGQFSHPFRIAVDQGSHAIYVGTENSRVQKFKSNGEFERMWGWDVVASGPDDDATPPEDQFEVCVPANGDVCKAGLEGGGPGQFGLEEDPIAVGPGGVVYVGDKLKFSGSDQPRVEKFEPSGAFLGALSLPLVSRLVAMAVSSSGDIYAFPDFGPTLGIHKYHPDGSEYGAPYPLDPAIQTTALAVGPADSLFAGQSEGVLRGYRPTALYSSSGATLSRFGYQDFEADIAGLAPFESPGGDVFALRGEEGIKYLSVPGPGPIVPPLSVEAPSGTVSNTKASLLAKVNPEGKATSYRFDYVTKHDFEEQGNSFDGPATKSTPIKSAGSDFNLQTVEEGIGCSDPVTEVDSEECLTPGTEYRFRIVATNPDKPTGGGEAEGEGEFTTRPPLEIGEAWSTEVGVDAARLNVEVNPLGIPATGYFEYVEDAKFQESNFAEAIQVPDVGGGEVPLSFGAGEAMLARSVSLEGLKPATIYHYRPLAANPLISEPIVGPELTFTTFAPVALSSEACANEQFRTGLGAFLPDCRAYEMVSPLEKNSGDILPLEEPSFHLPAALDQSSGSGARITYGSYRAFGEPEGTPYTSQYLAARDEDTGWHTHNLSPPRGATVLRLSAGLQLNTEFKYFAPDLCQSWIRTITEPQLEPLAVKGFANVYRRTDQECGGKSWEALTRVTPPNRLPEEYYPLELQGVSADGSHAIYIAPDNLTEDAPNIGEGTPGLFSDDAQLYEWDGNELHFVCILPGEVAHAGSCSAGTANNAEGDSRTASLQNAISADGSRVFWTATPADVGTGKIYVRIDNAETHAVSAAAEAIVGTSSSQYWTAARDGSVAVFSTGGRLFAYNVDTETTTQIAASGLIGVMGASEDATTRVYFASSAALSGEEANGEGDKAKAGKPNLYVYEGGVVKFIGTLADIDVNLTFGNVPVAAQPRFRTSRVSADGEHAAFMSAARLTHYDSTDAVSGKADAEAFLYDAESGKLICASCNPTGARPAGSNIGESVNQYWSAGQIPVWSNSLHASNLLADNGSRLYFQSTDALVARDTNGVGDVYQWEKEGVGGCDAEDANFAPESEGCIELISSGKSPRAAAFVDADSSGKNVFIRTLSALVPQDYGLVDIYDAREGGGFPPPPPKPVECEGEACQSPPPPPQAPTPASSNEGPGNLEEARTKPKKSCPKGKRRSTKAGKARCVKKKQKRQSARHNSRRTAR